MEKEREKRKRKKQEQKEKREQKKKQKQYDDDMYYAKLFRMLDERMKLQQGPANDEKLILPFNMECKGCNFVIAAGVKFDYERELVHTLAGKFWRLHTKCPCCESEIAVQTCSVRPGYIIVKGAEEHPKRAKSQAGEEMARLRARRGLIKRTPEKPKGDRSNG